MGGLGHLFDPRISVGVGVWGRLSCELPSEEVARLVEARRPWRPRVAIDAARARGLGALGAAIASRIRPSSLSISCSRIEGAATTFGVRVRRRLRWRRDLLRCCGGGVALHAAVYLDKVC